MRATTRPFVRIGKPVTGNFSMVVVLRERGRGNGGVSAPRLLRNLWLLPVVALAAMCALPASDLLAQGVPFCSSPEFQAIFAELARKVPRPSRLSGGELWQKPLPPGSC